MPPPATTQPAGPFTIAAKGNQSFGFGIPALVSAGILSPERSRPRGAGHELCAFEAPGELDRLIRNQVGDGRSALNFAPQRQGWSQRYGSVLHVDSLAPRENCLWMPSRAALNVLDENARIMRVRVLLGLLPRHRRCCTAAAVQLLGERHDGLRLTGNKRCTFSLGNRHKMRVESFHGRLGEECLAVSWFQNLFDARRKIAPWRKEYNEERPHGSLGIPDTEAICCPSGELQQK